MQLLVEADLIIYHGLHLEAKLADVLEKVGQTRRAVAAAEVLNENDLISPPNSGGAHDPHVWFDVLLWKQVCSKITEALGEAAPAHKPEFEQRLAAYATQLDELHAYVQQRAAEVPERQRVLVTAHDAFNYFGKQYGFDVVGLQGISTEAEAGTGDVQELSRFIAERKLAAIFVESSVPVRNIEALVAATKSHGHTVKIGGSLYSDAMGDKGTAEGTYLGMVRHNIDTIVNALASASTTNKTTGPSDGS
jgi:manganese/zinc/iron transport system substrate-binding protein